MRKITKFPKLVIEEAKNLKKNATKEELENLNFEELDPDWPVKCIYGQMTGSCNSERAVNLIVTCAKRVYHSNCSNGKTLSNKLNGSPVGLHRNKYWSPIEVFIINAKYNDSSEMNNKLIQYLKGERKTLK